jgi:cell division inhibitor SulA
MSDSRLQLVRELTRRMRALEKSGAGAERSPVSQRDRASLAGKLAACPTQELRDWLPKERAVVEWLAQGPGSGTAALALAAMCRDLPDGRALVVVDPQREFYPPGVTPWGFDLARVVVVRPGSAGEALWALEQALRCRGVGAVFCRWGPLDDRASRRLQLAAEHGGSVGVLVRPACYRRQPSWADVRLLVRPMESEMRSVECGVENSAFHIPQSALHRIPSLARRAGVGGSVNSATPGRRLRVEVLFRRGGDAGGTLEVELCDATGDLRVVPGLGGAAGVQRAAGA